MEPMNHVENLGSPRSLCLFPTDPKPENRRCKRNTEDTRRLSSAWSQAARQLGRTADALAVEWTSRTPRVGNETSSIQTRTNNNTTAFGAGRARAKEGAASKRTRHRRSALVSCCMVGAGFPYSKGTSPIRDVRRRLCSHHKLQPHSGDFCVLSFPRRMAKQAWGPRMQYISSKCQFCSKPAN